MAPQLRDLLDSRGWVFLTGLWLPFFATNLVLKAARIESLDEGWLWGMLLLRSEIFFAVSVLCISVAFLRQNIPGSYRRIIGCILIQFVCLLMLFVEFGTHFLFMSTGSVLDSSIFAFGLGKGDQLWGMLDDYLAIDVWMFLSLGMLILTVGPWVVLWICGREATRVRLGSSVRM